VEIFQEEFIRYAVTAGVMIGGLCAFLGVYVILKRIVFLGITLAEVSALGVAAGLMAGINPVVFSLILTVVAVTLFWIPRRNLRLSRESIIGFAYVLAAALAVILIAKNPVAESKGLDLVSGNLLYVEMTDLITVAILTTAVVVLHLILYRSFLFVSFDPDTAAASGLNAPLYNFLIYLSIGVTVGVTMKVAGILFVFGSLVVSPMTGLVLSRRMPGIIVISIIHGITAAVAGTALSVLWDLPTSPVILVTSCCIFALAAGAKAISR
jgi:ABC-type Mn2+/Zn2+ transport system permease subunit